MPLSVSRCFLATVFALILSTVTLPAQAASVASVMRGDAIKWQGTVIDLGPLKSFYRSKFNKGIWTAKSGLSKRGAELVKVLSNAEADGLEAADYLSGFPANPDNLSKKELAAAELFLSQAFWRFGRDLYSGRTTPAVSEPDIVISRKKIDVKGWLKSASKHGPAKVFEALRPQHRQYGMLRQMLASASGAKAKQIIINMERWRWLPRNLGKRYVMVNQAAFEMYLNEEGKMIDRRRVVVGKPFHKTPMFSHAIQYAEFNPTWTVSRSIAGNEFLPKLRKDPGYLEKRNYKIYTSWEADAPAMSAHTINWDSVSSKDFPYRIVQQPGENNALGNVKFIFPNKFKVYLHDTQSKQLFSESSRAFSHGCIRVENPMEFAEKLYASERSLPASKINEILASKKTQRIKMKKPVDVHLSYFTVWVDDTGAAKFHKDIYGRDKLVGKILFGGA